MESVMTKITHTPNPLITSTGFIPDESTSRNDEYYRQMLLSAMESWSFAAEHRLPEMLATRLDSAVDALRSEVLGGGE